MGLTKDFEDALEIVEGITQEVYNGNQELRISRSSLLEKEQERFRCIYIVVDLENNRNHNRSDTGNTAIADSDPMLLFLFMQR